MRWRCIILMGQANSEGLQPRSLLAKNWLPMERDPNILVHRVTQEQLQRHYIRILVKDLPRETALFSARMASHHPHICRLLYFHPAAPEQRNAHDHERDFREMYIYTDRMVTMRAWRRERVVAGLQGLRRLISIHGPIKITERMISENEAGEVKVWISENPVNNHPDSKYMSQEQSMGDFAAILTKKNQELANLLIGCITLKQAYERLSKQREEHSPHQNYSHRASGSGDFKRRMDIKDKNLTIPYKNVFGGTPEPMAKAQGPFTPKNAYKGHEKYPQSSFLPKETDKSKPVSQINDLSKYRDFLIPKRSIVNEDKTNKSNPKINNNESSLEYRKREDYAQQRFDLKHNKLNETSFDGSKKNNGQNLSFANSNKSFAFQHRFQTISSIPPVQNYPSPKGKQQQNWNSSNQISNVYASQSECPKDTPKWHNNFKEERSKAGGFDITIINNNVNNYISNITHNHIAKAEKVEKEGTQPKSQTTHQFKNYSRVADQNSSLHSTSQFMKQSQKTAEKQYNIPIFLQQKKKTSMQWAQQSAEINEKLKSTNLSRKNTVSSNPSYQSPQFSSENNLDRIIQDQIKASPAQQRPQKKSFNLTRNNQSSMSTQKMASFFNSAGGNPLTPTPLSNGYQAFTSFQKNMNSFQFKFPLRTKTMEFYQKGKGVAKNEELQNKSFTQADFQSSNDLRPHKKKEQSISAYIQPKAQATIAVEETIQPLQMNQQQQAKPGEKKLEFKKQLRNQFKNLLGGDVKEKQQEPVVTTLSLAIDEKAEAKECREGNLKEKIIRKKTAFAQLKKEALKVLTDE